MAVALRRCGNGFRKGQFAWRVAIRIEGFVEGEGFAHRAGDVGDRGSGVREDFGFERKEVISMGWWRTGSGGVIGDGPANVIEEFDERYWLETTNIPSDVRARINACYREDLDREPTEQELRDLLEFCGPGPEKD